MQQARAPAGTTSPMAGRGQPPTPRGNLGAPHRKFTFCVLCLHLWPMPLASARARRRRLTPCSHLAAAAAPIVSSGAGAVTGPARCRAAAHLASGSAAPATAAGLADAAGGAAATGHPVAAGLTLGPAASAAAARPADVAFAAAASAAGAQRWRADGQWSARRAADRCGQALRGPDPEDARGGWRARGYAPRHTARMRPRTAASMLAVITGSGLVTVGDTVPTRPRSHTRWHSERQHGGEPPVPSSPLLWRASHLSL